MREGPLEQFVSDRMTVSSAVIERHDDQRAEVENGDLQREFLSELWREFTVTEHPSPSSNRTVEPRNSNDGTPSASPSLPYTASTRVSRPLQAVYRGNPEYGWNTVRIVMRVTADLTRDPRLGDE